MSDETALAIDREVRNIIDECYDKAHQLLEDNRDKLDMMADALMQYETIDSEQIDDIMAGREPREPDGWGGDEGGDSAGGAGVAEDTRDASSPIGGPAGEH